MLLVSCADKVITATYTSDKYLYEQTFNLPYVVIYQSQIDSNEYVFWKDSCSHELNLNIKQVNQRFGSWFIDTNGDANLDQMKTYIIGSKGTFTVLQTYYTTVNYSYSKYTQDMVTTYFAEADSILQIGIMHMKSDLEIKIENDSLELITR